MIIPLDVINNVYSTGYLMYEINNKYIIKLFFKENEVKNKDLIEIFINKINDYDDSLLDNENLLRIKKFLSENLIYTEIYEKF